MESDDVLCPIWGGRRQLRTEALKEAEPEFAKNRRLLPAELAVRDPAAEPAITITAGKNNLGLIRRSPIPRAMHHTPLTRALPSAPFPPPNLVSYAMFSFVLMPICVVS